MPKSDNAKGKAMNGITGTAMPNSFVADAILLIGERQAHESGGQEVGVRTEESIERARADPKWYVLEAEQGGRRIRRRRAEVFAGA